MDSVSTRINLIEMSFEIVKSVLIVFQLLLKYYEDWKVTEWNTGEHKAMILGPRINSILKIFLLVSNTAVPV